MYIYSMAVYQSDVRKIEKLNNLTNEETFWDDVRKLTKRTYSDFHIGRWQCLAEARYNELVGGNYYDKTRNY